MNMNRRSAAMTHDGLKAHAVRRFIPAILAAALLGMLCTAPQLQAQKLGAGRGEAARLTPAERESVKELRDRIRAWAREEIIPTLTEYKRRLDAAMSSTDLAILNDLRKEAKEIRRSLSEHRKRLRRAWNSEEYDGVKEERAAISELQRRRIDIADLLIPLAIEYRETISELGDELRPICGEWRGTVMQMVEDWKTGQTKELEEKSDRFARFHNVLAEFVPRDVLRNSCAVRFMLWAGDMPEQLNLQDTSAPSLR